jgi:hypothetical protein
MPKSTQCPICDIDQIEIPQNGNLAAVESAPSVS